MAVELEQLYAEIESEFDVKLVTNSCFHKMIDWIHMVEDVDFVSFLRGDELVLNSGLNYKTEEWLYQYIKELRKRNAGGLILAMRDGMSIPQWIIQDCNVNEFALFSATWATSFRDIMRIFSATLLRNEQRDTNLNSALKNAIYFSENEELYLNHFERNGFFEDMDYNIIILSCNAYQTERGNEKIEKIKKTLRHRMEKCIVCEENEKLLILTAGYSEKKIVAQFRKMCENDSKIYVGIGTTVHKIQDIKKSYNRAVSAYQLTNTAIAKNMLCYPELGIYKLLADRAEEELYPEFVQETLGTLMEYDELQGTDYLEILMAYFENECSIIHTAEKIFCHKNTLTYKLNKIREILGYDIQTNENRMKIMVAIHIMKMERA